MASRLVLVKLGGSVLTNKGTTGTARFSRRSTLRLLRELRKAGEPFVLVHGAGSFGHPLALQYGIGKRRLTGRRLVDAIARTQAKVRELRTQVLAACQEAGLDVVDVPAPIVGSARNGRAQLDADVFDAALARGLAPVTGGDVVFDDRLGARVLSGDEILAILAAKLAPRRVVFVSDTDGIRLNGRTLSTLTTDEATRNLGKVGVGHDATGGMRAKLEQAIEVAKGGIPVAIVNGKRAGALVRALKGVRGSGTLIKPD